MRNELVKHEAASVPILIPERFALPAMVERAGAAGRFACEEFSYAEHHNPDTQAAYLRAVKRFPTWVDGQGVELPAAKPGMVDQQLVGLGGRQPSGTRTRRPCVAPSIGWSTAMR